MLKKKIALLLLACFCTLMLVAENKLKVLDITVPEGASPGQSVSAHITMEVLEVEEPAYLRPFAAYNLPKSKLGKNISANNMTPWRLTKYKVGDKLKVTTKFEVPEKAEVGEDCYVIFRVLHNKKQLKLVGKDRKAFKIVAPKKVDLTAVNKSGTTATAVIPILLEGAVVDGKLDKVVWKKAALLPVAFNSATGKKAAAPGEVRVFCDGKKLYVAFTAFNVKNSEVRAKKFDHHDAPIWNNDCVEYFFTPDYTGNEYTQFMADLLDQHYDSLNNDFHGYNPVWQSKTVRSADSWVIEAAIPLDAVSAGGVKAGTIWRAGFFRMSKGGTENAGWTATMGNHNGVKRHGYIVFGSLDAALDNAISFLPRTKNILAPALQKIADQIRDAAQGRARSDANEFVSALEKISELKKQFEKQQFIERFANNKSPLIVQEAVPFAHGAVKAVQSSFASGINADFYPGEVRAFAFNLTNTGNKSMIVRAAFISPKDKKGIFQSANFLYQGISGYKSSFFEPTVVASGDGSLTSDVLNPNPAGVWKLAPGETAQMFITVQAPDKALAGEGVLMIKSIDRQDVELIELPVKFRTIDSGCLSKATRPIATGWDFIWVDVANDRPEYAKKHWQILRDYGFNMTMLSGLRHLPRPKADKNGNIVGKMDFTVLRNHIAKLGKDFDHYYFDVAVWEKNWQRKDLFGLDFNHPKYEKAFKSWFAAVIAEFAELGIPKDRLVVCPLDEALDDRAVKIASWIKAVDPTVRVIIDTSSNNMEQVKKIDKYVNVWMPHMKTLPQEALQEFHKYLLQINKERLLYYYSTGANEKLKKPYADYICNFFRAFERGFGGLGYWAAGQYYGDPWYRRAYKRGYDTALMYPGESGPVPSRRLAAWRRGVQDLWLLRETEKRYSNDSNVTAKLREAAKAVADYPNDPARAEELRQYCRKLLENRPAK